MGVFFYIVVGSEVSLIKMSFVWGCGNLFSLVCFRVWVFGRLFSILGLDSVG